MTNSSEAYDITTISFKKRLIYSALVGVTLIGIGLSGLYTLYLKGDLASLVLGLAFIIGGCYLSHKIYTTKEKRKLKGTWVEVVDSDGIKSRKKLTLIILGVCAVIAAFLITSAYLLPRFYSYFKDLGEIFFIFIVVLVAYLIVLWCRPYKTRNFILSAASLVEKQRLDDLNAEKSLEDTKKWEEREKHWWFRYPLAALICVGAWWLSDIKPNMWWVGIIGVIYAMILAREISLLVLGIGAIYLVVQGIASLPVSIAIIIGALIIASAIKQ